MSIVSTLFSFPFLTLLAATETILGVKVLQCPNNLQSRLIFTTVVVLINYGFGLLFWLFLHPRFLSPLRHIPGPRAFFSDTLRAIIVKDEPSGNRFLRLAKKYSAQDMIVLNVAATEIFVTNPRLLADVLVNNCYDFAKPTKVSSFLRHILGDGLIIVEGDEHKFLRKNTMPAFQFRHIKNLYPMMWTKAEALVNALTQEIAPDPIDEGQDSAVVDLTFWASKITLDIIGVAGLGHDMNTIEKSGDPLHEIYTKLLDPTPEKLVYSMLGLMFGMRFANKASRHETTASALTWACYLLAKQPEIQRKVREEVLESITPGVTGGLISDLAGNLEQLPYLNGTINETLRLYPTVPMIQRQAIRDTQIGKQFIPKGTTIAISIWYVNRCPDFWGPDACEFRPERWVTNDLKPNKNGGASSNYDFLTFSRGPRNCIGQGFAKAEMRCLLAAMAMSFTWDLAMDDKKVVPRGVITIKPENGMYLRLTPLRKNTS
ncbi:cytochrome P450 4F4 [Verticillium alfalfae VaMs.102]|uniref:Cytochrome P450 4F4 n=1 Tax=Verticillium alfalfae (strain VaMs.102 / ATCC MYA-4576 / FGSC 10136) TaxID=526221 RepID=C9SUF4_VERA1|nr:cytochrome P450 4F4 [Verticillium alfalfae VaMs.102]EEY22465.1 cytochrome P450 4F4 [Verticillium alfalfae VaMs.102]